MASKPGAVGRLALPSTLQALACCSANTELDYDGKVYVGAVDTNYFGSTFPFTFNFMDTRPLWYERYWHNARIDDAKWPPALARWAADRRLLRARAARLRASRL